jgi:patatin-like phospholipase/acyl hydrolase
MGQKFRILSIDGGGLRGIIPVMILQEIEKRTGKRIHELFDLIAGTSTGALVACAVSLGDGKGQPEYTLDEVLKVYTERGKEIFPHKTGLAKFFRDVSSVFNPEFSAKGIDHVLRELLGTKKITDCLKPLFITTYDLGCNEAVFFKTRHAIRNEAENAQLYDVCRATSAGPTFLPAYECTFDNKKRVFVDGGVFMNNPAVGAVVEVSKYHKEKPYSRDVEDIFPDICVLSIGTGHYSCNLVEKIRKGGLLRWAQPISDLMMQGVNQATTYQADELLEDNQFLRLTIDIDAQEHSNMADSSDETRNYLIKATNEQIINDKLKMIELDNFLEVSCGVKSNILLS